MKFQPVICDGMLGEDKHTSMLKWLISQVYNNFCARGCLLSGLKPIIQPFLKKILNYKILKLKLVKRTIKLTTISN